jgi:hypothetical protein
MMTLVFMEGEASLKGPKSVANCQLRAISPEKVVELPNFSADGLDSSEFVLEV